MYIILWSNSIFLYSFFNLIKNKQFIFKLLYFIIIKNISIFIYIIFFIYPIIQIHYYLNVYSYIK